MKKSKKYKKEYRYPIKMDWSLRKPLIEIAAKENDTINDVIVVAIENLVKKHKEENAI